MNSDEAKRQAALVALKEVQDGMVVGLGTGSTAAIFVDALIERARNENLKLVAIPTSEKTAHQAEQGGIKLTDFSQHQTIDVTFDGADAVDLTTFAMLKGLGGALLREKIVAQASKRVVIMIDDTKIPQVFGGVLPIEIVRFGYQATMARLEAIGEVRLRKDKASGETFFTDGGNYIADMNLPDIANPMVLQTAIRNIAGVVETGLFIDLAHTIISGGDQGVRVFQRP